MPLRADGPDIVTKADKRAIARVMRPKYQTRERAEAKAAFEYRKNREGREREEKDNFFSRALKATGRAASSVLDEVGDVTIDPRALSSSGRVRGGGVKARDVANQLGELSGVNSVRRVRSGKGDAWDYLGVASMGAGPAAKITANAVRAAKSAPKLGIVALAQHRPDKLLNVEKYAGHGALGNLSDVRLAADDLNEYADAADESMWQRSPHSQGKYAGESLHSPVARAIHSMNPANREVVQKKARAWSDELQEGLRSIHSRGGVGSLPQDPAHLSKAEFAASPWAAFHATQSAPGLSSVATREGVHTGSMRSAFERMVALAAFRTSARSQMEKFRMLPVAMRGRVLSDEVSDPKANDWLSQSFTEGRPYSQGVTPQQLNKLRAAGRAQYYAGSQTAPKNARSLIDVVPYENTVEGIGDISFLATNPRAYRTHLDLIRDYIATYGEIPAGIEDYPNPKLLEARLRREIAEAQAQQVVRVDPRRAINNAIRASLPDR